MHEQLSDLVQQNPDSAAGIRIRARLWRESDTTNMFLEEDLKYMMGLDNDAMPLVLPLVAEVPWEAIDELWKRYVAGR